MNPLTNVRNIKKLSERELERNTKYSWHDDYKDSAWIFVGGVDRELSEGDVISIFSQYGEIVDINMVRDKENGAPLGYGFICYEDQRSTILAVDNFNGIKVLGRVLRVDHVRDYKIPKNAADDEYNYSNYISRSGRNNENTDLNEYSGVSKHEKIRNEKEERNLYGEKKHLVKKDKGNGSIKETKKSREKGKKKHAVSASKSKKKIKVNKKKTNKRKNKKESSHSSESENSSSSSNSSSSTEYSDEVTDQGSTSSSGSSSNQSSSSGSSSSGSSTSDDTSTEESSSDSGSESSSSSVDVKKKKTKKRSTKNKKKTKGSKKTLKTKKKKKDKSEKVKNGDRKEFLRDARIMGSEFHSPGRNREKDHMLKRRPPSSEESFPLEKSKKPKTSRH